MRCDFGDIVLVPFPFTDQTTLKKRPAVVVSSAGYHRQRIEIVVMAISSQAPSTDRGDLEIEDWQQAGLLKPSFVKPIFATLEHRLVRRKLGRLGAKDRQSLHDLVRSLLGS